MGKLMPQEDCILAIDYGTQSVRAVLFDLKGKQLGAARVVVEPYYSDKPGWAEQQADYFWQKTCQACRELWESTAIPREAIRGVAMTCQRATMINVDRQGKALRPAIIWLDRRLTAGLKPVGGKWGLA